MTASASPPPELHLPDLPEVPVTLGPVVHGGDSAPVRVPLGLRVRDAVSTYLPLLLMALLASGTWWLVKHTPMLDAPAAARAVRHDPDYTMKGFNVVRFAPDGRFAMRLQGDELRHYPDTDRLEIDGVRIEAVAPDGRTTRASARRALANGDVSEVQLIGGARVVADLGGGDALEIDGEFLHAFLRFERLRSHQPVEVRRGGGVTRAGGLDYDHLARELRLEGPVRSRLPPTAARPPTSASAAAGVDPAPAAPATPTPAATPASKAAP
ncbi:LPS export ABC transporter periplasmic protein LptC [Ideonella sp. A 288]|uniref:LPS export ABC transporter periplasmic protein LptC n=1 Tax=Ideonella sp. A 288 TaxID=1962181 RepID=UPI0018FEF338|nr:LPS export ABC transporter periplasmic protein LptC [Ideonella sp. A 288]